jgi:cytochrome P450
MMHLINNPSIYKRLQDELDALFESKPLSISELDRAPLLNAVVNETLRLLPPITSGVKRESPGAVICGKFIPAGVPVRTPNYTLSRDPRYFSPAPDAFRPDRWLEPKKEQAFNRAAFFPLWVSHQQKRKDWANYMASSMIGPFGTFRCFRRPWYWV